MPFFFFFFGCAGSSAHGFSLVAEFRFSYPVAFGILVP